MSLLRSVRVRSVRPDASMPRSPGLWSLSLPALLAMGGCSAIVDGAIPADPPTADTCSGLADGTECTREGITSPLICLENRCTSSRCGDGVVDRRPKSDGAVEECDDPEGVMGETCRPDCTLTPLCASNSDCPASDVVCFASSCNTDTGECVIAEAADGSPCSIAEGVDGSCTEGTCSAPGCGNGTLDAGESCDDGNISAGDGCSAFCQPECANDGDCASNACDGYERCEATSGASGEIALCVPDTDRPVVTCSAPCEVCDATTAGCVPSAAADMDLDGHTSLACGGDDCDDTNANINPGRDEGCGDGIDSNCNGDADEGAMSTYYADCDEDNFALERAPTMMSCAVPSSGPAACPDGGWTTRRPTTSADCVDSDSSISPNQRGFSASSYTIGRTNSFDYNCDGVEEPEFARSALPTAAPCGVGCSAAPVVAASAECGASATRYSCVLADRICRRVTVTSPRYFLRCR